MLPETAPHHHYDGGVFRGMKNAKWSFVVGQNEVMREYEEYGSRITGGLIRNRIKKDSGSICAATPEELQEMGYDQFEYENYMRPRSETSHSSSQGSVTSAKMEDEEGFQQINDCLNHKAQEKKLSGENNSVTAQTSSSTVMTPQSTEPAFNHGKQEYKGITHPLEVMEESD